MNSSDILARGGALSENLTRMLISTELTETRYDRRSWVGRIWAGKCRVLKGAGSQSVVRCVSTYSGGLAQQGFLQGSRARPQLLVFILGTT